MEDDDCGKLVSKLIHEVSQKPILYDPQNPMYKDNPSRARAWQSIAEKMNMPVTNCQIKWGTLRRCLSNARKRQKRRQAIGSKYIKKWRYQDEMAFLLPYIDNREMDFTFGVSKKTKTPQIDDTTDSRSHDLYISEEYEQSDLDESEAKPSSDNLQHYLMDSSTDQVDFQRYTESTPKIVHQKSPTQHLYEEEQVIGERSEFDKSWDTPQKYGRRSHDVSSMQSFDEMDMFFLSMSKTLKKLPRLDQIKVRSEIYEVVTQAEVNWLQKSDSQGTNSD